jgi:hypothetical protein
MAEQSIPIPRQRRLKERASDEFKRFIVIFLYLWVVFGLLSIHKSFVLHSFIWTIRSMPLRLSMRLSLQRSCLSLSILTSERDSGTSRSSIRSCTVLPLYCRAHRISYPRGCLGGAVARKYDRKQPSGGGLGEFQGNPVGRHHVFSLVATILPVERARAGGWSQRIVGSDSQVQGERSETSVVNQALKALLRGPASAHRTYALGFRLRSSHIPHFRIAGFRRTQHRSRSATEPEPA